MEEDKTDFRGMGDQEDTIFAEPPADGTVSSLRTTTLSHKEFMSEAKRELAAIFEEDPLLGDLFPDITVDEVKAKLALEHGQAMLVNVERGDGELLSTVVKLDATVMDLKHAIQCHVNLREKRRKNGVTAISWHYVWKMYALCFEKQKLTNNSKKLTDYGIRNRAAVTFVKQLQRNK